MKRCVLTALMFSLALPVFAAVEQELKDAGGKTVVRYVVEAPDNIAPAGTRDPAKQVGLILCSSEHDRPTGDEIYPVREALLRLGISDQYVLLAGHSQAQKFGPADDEPLEKLMRWAMKTYPVNPRRVYMYGKGEGSKISYELTMLHPDLVTAGIGYSWGLWRMPSEVDKPIDFANSAPEFYMVLGMRDLSYHITTVRDAYQRLSNKGYHVIYREFDDLGARTYHPPSNDDAIAWATRLRNKNLSPSAEEQALLNKTQINADGYIGNLALVGGAPAGLVIQKLLQSRDADVRAAAAETCVHGIFGEATISAVGNKLTDPSAKVRQAVFRALAVNAKWRSAAAQNALTEFALDPGKFVEPVDREAAVDAMNFAAQLQLHGFIQDPELFRTLILLLNDKNEEIRTMAANTLEPARDSSFRGDLGRPELKEPAGGWPHWLDVVTAKANNYRDGYRSCAQPAANAFCEGVELLSKDPARGFALTLQAAEQGSVPAEAMVGMLYATGKGTQLSFADATQWWTKAAEAGNTWAAQSLSMVYRGGAGIKADAALSEKWGKFAAEHAAAN